MGGAVKNAGDAANTVFGEAVDASQVASEQGKTLREKEEYLKNRQNYR
jgi:hypothetical protein